MPSRDRIDRKANEWMEREGLSSPSSATSPASSPTSRHARAASRSMSAQVQRLSRRLGVDPDKLAAKYPPDTIRRTKFPVVETVNTDGTRSFRHPTGIEEGRRALLQR